MSIGWTVPSPKLLTQTVFPSGVGATSAAVPPTLTVAVTALVARSMTVTSLVLLFATNSRPAAVAIPSGPLPTGIGGPAPRERVSTGVTVLSL